MELKLKINLIFAALMAILLSNSASAQRGSNITHYASPLDPSAKSTPIYIGPAAGVNILGHSMTVKTFSSDVLCPTFNNANGLGFYVGLTFEYLLGKDAATSNSAIIVRALYNMMPGNTTIDGDNYPARDPETGSIIYTTTDHQLDIKYDVATLEVMYKYNPIPGFGIGLVAGPTFDFALTKTWKQTWNLLEPNHAQFKDTTSYPMENNNRTIVVQDGEIPNSSAFRFGLKAGVQYELLLGSKFYIVPSLCYNFGITNLTSDYDWRVSPLQIGLDARYAFAL